MHYRDAFAWRLRQLMQSGKTEVVFEKAICAAVLARAQDYYPQE
jgi:hypothetical protein